MKIGGHIVDEEFDRTLQLTLGDEHFIAMFIDQALAPLAQLVPSGLSDVVDRLQSSVYALGTLPLSDCYRHCMRDLLHSRFDGWDMDDLDLFVWRLLHQDAVAALGGGLGPEASAPLFWCQVLGHYGLDVAGGGLAHDSSPGSGRLAAHAIGKLSQHLRSQANADGARLLLEHSTRPFAAVGSARSAIVASRVAMPEAVTP